MKYNSYNNETHKSNGKTNGMLVDGWVYDNTDFRTSVSPSVKQNHVQ